MCLCIVMKYFTGVNYNYEGKIEHYLHALISHNGDDKRLEIISALRIVTLYVYKK